MSEQCDTGVRGRSGGDWVAQLDGGRGIEERHLINTWDNPLEFALFGLARQDAWPGWVETNWTKPVLDLGPGNKIIHGAIRCEYPRYNFESPEYMPVARTTSATSVVGKGRPEAAFGYIDDYSHFRCTLPWPDNSVGGIYAVNILEHLWDPRPIMAECARVLAPGCPFNIVVPHGSHGIYLQDIDHKKPFILDSWKNWLQNGYWGPDRSDLKLRIGANFKFGIKEENVNIMTQLIKEA